MASRSRSSPTVLGSPQTAEELRTSSAPKASQARSCAGGAAHPRWPNTREIRRRGGGHMSQEEFRTALRRMAEVNGLLFLKEEKLLDLLAEDIRGGARFINIFRGNDKKELLLVTSRRTLAVTSGAFSTKLK